MAAFRPQQRRIVDWLKSVGATAVRIDRPSRLGHPHLSFTFNGREYDRPVAATPGDGNGWKVTIEYLARELGLRPERPRRSTRPGKRRRRSEAEVVGGAIGPAHHGTRGSFNTPFAGLGELVAR